VLEATGLGATVAAGEGAAGVEARGVVAGAADGLALDAGVAGVADGRGDGVAGGIRVGWPDGT